MREGMWMGLEIHVSLPTEGTTFVSTKRLSDKELRCGFLRSPNFNFHGTLCLQKLCLCDVQVLH